MYPCTMHADLEFPLTINLFYQYQRLPCNSQTIFLPISQNKMDCELLLIPLSRQ